MHDRDDGGVLKQQLLTMQIVAGSLIGGVLIFAGVTVLLGAWNAPEQPGVLKYVGLFFPAMVLVPFVLVPSLITPANLQHASSEEEPAIERAIGGLAAIYQTRMIVRLALLEGAAFMNLIAFLIEHARWSLVVAGVLVFFMLAIFPTRMRLEQWIEAERVGPRGAG